MTTFTLRPWLASACGDAQATLLDKKSFRGEKHTYYSFLAEEMHVEPWTAFTYDKVLDTISRLYNDALDRDVGRVRPLVEAYERYVPNELSWVHLLSQTLMYHVKVALAELRRQHDPVVVIGPYWPFKNEPHYGGNFRSLQDYTPDFTVGLGDPHDLKALVMGDAKFRRQDVPTQKKSSPRDAKAGYLTTRDAVHVSGGSWAAPLVLQLPRDPICLSCV